MRLVLIGFLLSSVAGAQAQVRAVVPAQTPAHANRVYSPGVDAGDYVYVSGQGPRRPDGSLPATFAAQCRQALDNVKSVVESAGLTMEHVVYTQVYLEDISKYEEMNQVFAEVLWQDSAGSCGAGCCSASRTIHSDQCRRGAQFSRPADRLSAKLQSKASQLRRAFSRTTGCSYRACQAAIPPAERFRMIRQPRSIWHSTV